MTASLFGGGSSINVNATGTLVPQQFTPTDGQTVFTLTSFTYTINTNSLLVFINGTLQVPGTDYTETSSSSFTLAAPVYSTDAVRAIGFPLANFFQAGVGTNLTDIPTVAIIQNNKQTWLGTVAGSANAITGSSTPIPAALTAGMVFRFIASAPNTGAMTLTIGTLAAVPIKKSSALGLTDTAAGDIITGCAYQVVYDGTYFQLSGGVGSGGGASAGGVVYENSHTISSDYTMSAGKSGHTIGTLTVATGKTVTIPTGESLMVFAPSTGGAGTTDVLTTGAQTINGQKTFALFPNIAALPSMVRVDTAGATTYGSTNTVVRRFSNIRVNQGSDITYADSATLGASFTINTNGVYAINFSASCTAAFDIYLTLNDTTGTTANTLSRATNTLNYSAAISWTGYLPAGSVIRAVGDGGAEGARPPFFTISRVA